MAQPQTLFLHLPDPSTVWISVQAQGEALEALTCLDPELQAGQTDFFGGGQWREVGHKFPVGSLLSS